MPTQTSSPRTQRKAAADFTGRQTEKLDEVAKVEKADAAKRVALATATAAEAKETIIDLSDPENPVPEVQIRKVEVNNPYRIIRTNTTLNQVTFGRQVIDPGEFDSLTRAWTRAPVMGPMVMYDLEEGQPYKVSKEFAEHLNERGYLAYMGNA